MTLKVGANGASTTYSGVLSGSGILGSETWNGGGTYVWEINNGVNPATTAGTNYDLLSISGTLTLAATSDTRFIIELHSLLPNNGAGEVINFNSAINSTYRIASASGGITGFDEDSFSIYATDFMNDLSGGSWSVTRSGNDLNLNFVAAIPEPSAASALSGLGILAFAVVVHRRRAAHQRSVVPQI